MPSAPDPESAQSAAYSADRTAEAARGAADPAERAPDVANSTKGAASAAERAADIAGRATDPARGAPHPTERASGSRARIAQACGRARCARSNPANGAACGTACGIRRRPHTRSCAANSAVDDRHKARAEICNGAQRQEIGAQLRKGRGRHHIGARAARQNRLSGDRLDTIDEVRPPPMRAQDNFAFDNGDADLLAFDLHVELRTATA